MSIVLALSVQTLVDPALQTTTANDPGLDGTHPDLKLGANLKQNVLDTSNFSAQDAMLPITYQGHSQHRLERHARHARGRHCRRGL